MKRQIKLFVILLTLIFNIFGFARVTLNPVAKATYVEGTISQNTIWTLAETPFVISKDVIVASSATLTIEPGVEVKFGENASITVLGRLTAVGEESERIRFTSNKELPKAGDWYNIVFNSAATSILRYCTIEYGTNGTIIENGTVSILDCLVRDNSLNGIRIVNGNVRIEDNVVTDNNVTGILIAGGNNVTVQNNAVQSNGDGITLVGTLTSEIDIKQNDILLNKNCGISLNATGLDNTVIVYNNITQNLYGFQVSSSTSTYITHNYIENNTIGVFYAQGMNHEAHFNDIYSNKIGMNVYLPDRVEVVDASYNYWGDKSGPYHESLNPYGKGNTVLGNGVNLDFIFFLTAPFDYNNSAPTPILWTDKTLVARNQNVTFIGTSSYDDGKVEQYFFNFGDGTNSGWTTLSVVTHSFASTGTYSASLQVKDDFNVTSTQTFSTVQVLNLPQLVTSVTLSDYVIYYNGQVSVTAFVSDGTNPAENATVTLFSIKGGNFAPQIGLTNSTGYFTAIFTAPDATELINTQIIARANMTGYAQGSNFQYLEILAPFKAQITKDPDPVKSEETSIITVQVEGAYDEPIANAQVTLSSTAGYVMSPVQYTGGNGSAAFIFTAPQTMTAGTVYLTASITKEGYADTTIQGALDISPRTLVVQVFSEPDVIESEATSTTTVLVTYNEAPIAQALVMVSSDMGGQFSQTVTLTDANGYAIFYFYAPKALTRVNATIMAIASEIGFLDGESQVIVTVTPKELFVEASTQPTTTVSEGEVNVTVHVGYDAAAVSQANVTITSGTYSATGMTSENGNVTLVFTAPPVNAVTKLTITARATKDGFVDGVGTVSIIVQPGTINVTVTTDKASVTSTLDAVAVVHVKCNGVALPNATITMSASDGTFLNATGLTDENGTCTFVYYAPSTSTPMSAVVWANVTKNGYISAGNYTTILVNPEAAQEGGFSLSLITILLIAIPIAIVVIIIVLIKLKVISLSYGEENE
jgi:parallel beta-helix repeat protein